jgi:hypothetical protein
MPPTDYPYRYFRIDTATKNNPRAEVIQAAKNHTLEYIYYLQTVHGMDNWQLSNDFGTKDKLAQIPYVPESRRIQGIKRLTENDVTAHNR